LTIKGMGDASSSTPAPASPNLAPWAILGVAALFGWAVWAGKRPSSYKRVRY